MHDLQRHRPLPTTYHQPSRLDEALQLLADGSEHVRPIAGGSDLLLEIARGARTGIEVLVDLSRVAGFDELIDAGDHLQVGCLVTHAQAVASPLVTEHALPLAQACAEIGGPQLRNRATVVGNVVTASPANDTISALLALDAEAEVASLDGTRRVPIAELILGYRQTSLRPGELVTTLRIPKPPPGRQAVFAKAGGRVAQAISTVHAALVLDRDATGAIAVARIALGSVGPTVVRVASAESSLQGSPLTDESIDTAARLATESVTPIDDVRADARYRTELVRVIVARSLRSFLADDPPIVPASGPRLWSVGISGRRAAGRGSIDHVATDLITSRVNGQSTTAPWTDGWTLLDWLRATVDPVTGRPRTGTKEGCAEGECGACTVVMDGMATLACLIPAPVADRAEITTVEGCAEAGALHPLQEAFVARAAVQCGFCTPGFVVAGCQLLHEVRRPEPSDVRLGLSGNLCRCTGYQTMFDAFADAAEAMR